MTDVERIVMKTAAEILRFESRTFFDAFKHDSDSQDKVLKSKALKNYERYQNLERIARELDIISMGGL